MRIAYCRWCPDIAKLEQELGTKRDEDLTILAQAHAVLNEARLEREELLQRLIQTEAVAAAVSRNGQLTAAHLRAWANAYEHDLGYDGANLCVWLRAVADALAARIKDARRLVPDLNSERMPPCSHPGCYSHVTHPCEGCGRYNGYTPVAWVTILHQQLTAAEARAEAAEAALVAFGDGIEWTDIDLLVKELHKDSQEYREEISNLRRQLAAAEERGQEPENDSE